MTPLQATGWEPADEHARLGMVERVLSENAPLRHAVDLISEGVATALDVPFALVSLVGRERQYFLGHSDANAEPGTPLSHSFCKYVVARGDKLIIDAAVGHPLVGDNPAIVDSDVHAYAGQPIIVQGQTLGSLCAFDHVPRTWTDREVAALRQFADAVQYLIEARVLNEEPTKTSAVHTREATARLAVYEALAGEHASAASLGRRLQHALLPVPGATSGLGVEVFYEPGADRLLLGGAFVDTLEDQDGVLHFVIGDVSGNGPEAAALAIGLRSSWHALQSIGTEPAQTVRVLDHQAAQAGLYATLLVGSLSRAGQLSLVNAGHPDPVMIGQTVMELATDPGPMLGLGLTGARWRRSDHQVPDQTFLAYTEGLTAGTIHQSGEHYDIEQLLAAIAELGPEPVLLCRAAVDARGEPLSDDVAMLRISLKD